MSLICFERDQKGKGKKEALLSEGSAKKQPLCILQQVRCRPNVHQRHGHCLLKDSLQGSSLGWVQSGHSARPFHHQQHLPRRSVSGEASEEGVRRDGRPDSGCPGRGGGDPRVAHVRVAPCATSLGRIPHKISWVSQAKPDLVQLGWRRSG